MPTSTKRCFALPAALKNNYTPSSAGNFSPRNNQRMRTDPMHNSVCDVCYMPTWYSTEQQCKRSYPKKKTCKVCNHTEVNHDKMIQCTGTLRVIDRSHLAPQFTHYYASQERIEIKTSYGEKMRGTVGKTSGWKPSYLLMATVRSIGSSVVLTEKDQVIRIIHKR